VRRCESGIALLIVTILLSMLLALALVLTSVTMTETAIAGGFADSAQVFYAAESAVDYAIHALGEEPDWQVVLDGHGSAWLQSADAQARIDAADGSGGVLYACGWLADLLPAGDRAPRLALAVWVSADPQPGVLIVAGHAYGANRSHRAVEVRVIRTPPTPDQDAPRLRVLRWRELR
jgi:hypothetical protein